ncbi:MAG: HAD family phosphatase [Cyclobacteriaceae bacterium]
MKGVIFDLDGTMIDNMMVHHRAWQQKLAELGVHMDLGEVMEKVHGINEEILERLFGNRFTPEERKRIAAEKEELYRNIYLPEFKPISGLVGFIEKLHERGIPVGIGTAAPPENMHFALDNLGIKPMIKTALHARDVSKGKPDPEIYIKAASGLGIDPKQCVIFEDTPVGAMAASSAGGQVIVITTTHKENEFREVPSVIRYINDYRGMTPDNIISVSDI